MPNQFAFRISQRPKRSDWRRFLRDCIADGNRKNKCNNHNQNIQKHAAHCLVGTHILRRKVDCRIHISRHVVHNFIFKNNSLCEKRFHKIVGKSFFFFLVCRLFFILPCICIVNRLIQTNKSALRHHGYIKF